MRLSPEQESELIEQNMPKICRAVDNFTVRCLKSVVKVPYEDFVQEVSIAFLEHIRKCDTMEQVEKFPWFDAMQVMSRLVLTYQPMSCPKRTGSFHNIVNSMPVTVSYETSPSSLFVVDGLSRHWIDEKESMMDLEMFVDSLPDYADRIIAMRLWGLPSRKIAAHLGISESAVSQRLNNYLKKYKDFIKEEDEDA